MEPIIKETQVIRDYDNGGGHNLRSRANWGLGLGIAGGLGGAKITTADIQQIKTLF